MFLFQLKHFLFIVVCLIFLGLCLYEMRYSFRVIMYAGLTLIAVLEAIHFFFRELSTQLRIEITAGIVEGMLPDKSEECSGKQ